MPGSSVSVASWWWRSCSGGSIGRRAVAEPTMAGIREQALALIEEMRAVAVGIDPTLGADDKAGEAVDDLSMRVSELLQAHLYPPPTDGDKAEGEQRSWERKRASGVDHFEYRVALTAEMLAKMIAHRAPIEMLEGTFIPPFERATADLIARARGKL